MKSYAQIQEELLSETPNGYKLQGYFHDHNLSLKEFILGFINDFSKKFPTVTNNAAINYPVCLAGKRRSLGDIFLISIHYYPTVTVKELFETLQELYDNHKIYGIFCKEIKKRVYCSHSGYFEISDTNPYYGYQLPDEWGWKPGKQRE